MDHLTGLTFGQYQIVAALGEGGMAAVYKAYQPSMARYVALKVLPRQYAAAAEFAARFQQEARLLARLQHPHILPVFDYGEAQGYTYLVMPYVEAGTLAGLLRGKPLPLPQVLRVISQVGDALDYAHSQGLIHRDVKPSNVLLDERGNCLLTDFGIAKLLAGASALTSTGTLIGTPAYMSPEQGRGEVLDPRSDLYALGVVLYEMLTGRVPYQAETPVAVIFKHAHAPLPPPRDYNPDLAPALEPVLHQALAKQPADRFATAGDLVQALQHAARSLVPPGSGVSLAQPNLEAPWGPPPGRPPAAARRGPGRWLPILLIGAGVLGLACLLGLGLALFWRPGPGGQLTDRQRIETAVEATGAALAALAPSATTAPLPADTLTPTARPSPSATSPPTATASPTVHATATQTPLLPRVHSFSACAQPCDGANATRSFPAGTTRIYATWTYENIPIGAAYVRSWTMNGLEWVRYTCNWPGPESGVDAVTLVEPDQLHSGTWEVTIVVDGQVLLREQVQVEGNVTYWYYAGQFDTCYGRR
jgi:serine/threonine-protein kinase